MGAHTEQIRRAVRRLSGCSVVSEAVWDEVVEYYEDVENAPRDLWTISALCADPNVVVLADEVRRRVEMSWAQRQAEVREGLFAENARNVAIPRVTIGEGPVRLSPLHSQRVVAYSMLVAAYAAKHTAVQRFRQQCLSTGLLDQAGARQFLNSPANATLPPGDFLRRGIPPAAHRAKIVNCEQYEDRLPANCGNDAREFFLHILPLLHRETVQRTVATKTVHLCRHEIGIQFTQPHEEVAKPWQEHDIWQSCPLGEIHFHEKWPYWSGSVLSRLKETITALCEAYPGWTEPDACGFILTGGAPSISPIRMSSHVSGGAPTYAKVTLEIEPWVPESVVLAAYRSARRTLCGRNTKQQGGEEKGYALVSFVCGHAEKEWPEIFRLWRKMYTDPKWQFNNSVDRFKQGWKRSHALVGFRPWGMFAQSAVQEAEKA
jgi:hypothetical protein